MKNENKCFAPMLRESKIDPFLSVATVTIKGKIDPTFIRAALLWPALKIAPNTKIHLVNQIE